MKNILIIQLLFFCCLCLRSQNIGIDVALPEYKLDVAGTVALRHPATNTAGIHFDGITMPAKTFFGMIDNDRLGIKSNVSNTWPLQINVNTGFTGIGNTSPGFNLDIKGRPRIRHNGSQSAGIWFDGTTAPQSSFIGTFDNNHTGLFGNGTWNLVMNVNNGNVGIGTTAPTSKLDVNGAFRMRSSFPKTGSVLTSIDANGNAEWEEVTAFKATGGYNNQPIEFNAWDTPAKVYFYQIPAYNIGFAYEANNSEFVAQTDGIYHFEASLEWAEHNISSSVFLKMRRNNTVITIANEDQFWSGLIAPLDYKGASLQPLKISVDYKLLAGDEVWVEVEFVKPQYMTDYNWISSSPSKTWFTGYLVTRI